MDQGCSENRRKVETLELEAGEELGRAGEIEWAYPIESADDHVSEARHQLWSVDQEKLDEGGRAELDEVLTALETAAEVLSWLLQRTGVEE